MLTYVIGKFILLYISKDLEMKQIISYPDAAMCRMYIELYYWK